MTACKKQVQEERPLKSIKSEQFSLVTFVNVTQRNASIYWLDYSGHRVRYAVLGPGEDLPLTTFVTHPWVFNDAETGDLLVTDGDQPVFFPPASDFGSPQPQVKISIPGKIPKL